MNTVSKLCKLLEKKTDSSGHNFTSIEVNHSLQSIPVVRQESRPHESVESPKAVLVQDKKKKNLYSFVPK
jgi:hypothetical protein